MTQEWMGVEVGRVVRVVRDGQLQVVVDLAGKVLPGVIFEKLEHCFNPPPSAPPPPKAEPKLHRIEKRIVAEQDGRYYLHPWEKE